MNSKADASTADGPAARTMATLLGSWLDGLDADCQGMAAAEVLP